MDAIHTPVLLRECLEYLGPEKGQEASPYLLIDSTLGEGGHAEAFLRRFDNLRIIGLDADSEIQARAKERLAPFGQRMTFYTVWFNDFFANFSISEGVGADKANLECGRPDSILFDLGISLFHYEKSGRGFSFRQKDDSGVIAEMLDMRLDASQKLTASDLVNGLSEKELAHLIFANSEERYSRRIAQAIVSARREEKITTASRLERVVFNAVPAGYRHGHVHPATKTWQALRIAVNREFERLGEALVDSFNALAAGGKLGVITFHSLEDRMVKIFFKSLSKECVCSKETPKCICGESCAELLTKKAIQSADDEVHENAPSRSAKLRVIKKTRALGDARKKAVQSRLTSVYPRGV